MPCANPHVAPSNLSIRDFGHRLPFSICSSNVSIVEIESRRLVFDRFLSVDSLLVSRLRVISTYEYAVDLFGLNRGARYLVMTSV